jgi:biopolymer transport protein ExbD
MAKFKKKNDKGVPAISTASLPDVIFMLLFFFMISTVMRDTSLKVDQKIPEAAEVQKLERKNLVSYIYVVNLKESLPLSLVPRTLFS